MKKHKFRIILFLLLIVFSLISLFIGVINIDIKDILNGDLQSLEIMVLSRFPRLLAIICTGMGMSVAGLIMQKLVMNRFVAPSTGATMSSAQLGILIALLFLPSSSLISRAIFSFAFAILGTGFFVFLVQKIQYKDVVMVPLVGIMFGNIISGITSFLSFSFNMSQSIETWMTGSFSLIVKGRYEFVYLVLPLIVIAFIYSNHFNIVGMGKDFSSNLGVNYKFVLFLGLSLASMLTASIVVIIGSIPYIGLIVPNIVAMFRGDNIKGSLVDTAIFGALFVLICDIIGRIVIFPYELPIQMVIGVIGSIVFIAILFKRLSKRRRGKPILQVGLRGVRQKTKKENIEKGGI